MKTITDAKFSLGKVVTTPEAMIAFSEAREEMQPYLERHARGDWGDLCTEDLQENDLALKHGCRLLSAYRLRDLEKIWIITEADRSVTTILLPDDY